MAKARQSPSGPVSNELLRGVGLTLNPDLTLSPIARPRRFYDWDYFISGGLTTSTIGKLGWTISGNGTPTVARFNSGLSATSRIFVTTSATAGDRACITLGETEARLMSSPLEFDNVETVWRVGTPITNKRTFFGWSSDFAVDPLTALNALGINFDTGVSPYFQFIQRQNGVTTDQITLFELDIPPTNTPQAMTFVQSAPGVFDFYSNTASTQSVQLYQATVRGGAFNANHGYRNETLANIANRFDLAYWGMNTGDLPGVLSSDNVLET